MTIQSKGLATLVCITGILCSYPGQSAPDEGKYLGKSISRLQSTPDSGFYATNLIDLIESVDIIVEGRYGDLIRNFPFYGYDGDGSDIPPQIDGFGIPTSEFEIIPSRILMGEKLVSNPLVLRVVGDGLGTPKLPLVVAQRGGTHLFFFNLNPDRRTVGLRGSMFDMKETDAAYTFISAGKIATALDSGDKDLFLRRVEAIIENEIGVGR